MPMFKKEVKKLSKIAKAYKELTQRKDITDQASEVFPKYLVAMQKAHDKYQKGIITAGELHQAIDLLVFGLTQAGFGAQKISELEMEELVKRL